MRASARFFAIVVAVALEAVSLRSALLPISVTDVVVTSLAARLLAVVNGSYAATQWTVGVVYAVHATM